MEYNNSITGKRLYAGKALLRIGILVKSGLNIFACKKYYARADVKKIKIC